MTMPDLASELTDAGKIKMNIITLNTAVNELQEDTKKLTQVVITGNGDLPLREQVRNLNAIVNEWKTWIKFFIGLMITQAVAVLGGIVVAYIKFLPVLEKLANQP